MITITNDFKKEGVQALMMARQNFTGSDAQFAKQWDIHATVFSQLKNGKLDGLLSPAQWLKIGREFGISGKQRKWNTARTQVFIDIEEDVLFCKLHSKSMIYVDECEIGKTHTAKYLARTVTNCFYVDASQAKTKQAFVRLIAKTIGADSNGKYRDVKENLKYALSLLENPIIIIDEAGDLEYTAFLELKELWNGTEGVCGWYMMGADGLRAKIETGIRNKKVGFKEIFSRYSSNYSSSVPRSQDDRIAFYRQLIADVLSVNMADHAKLEEIVLKCIPAVKNNYSSSVNKNEYQGALRRAESLLILNA